MSVAGEATDWRCLIRMSHTNHGAHPEESDRRPADPRRRLGQYGEHLAVAHLSERGWLILDRNWRSRWGEIDIVGLDKGTLVLCEVKTRAAGTALGALESITRDKHARLLRLGALWLQQRGGDRNHRVRLDAVGVRIHPQGTHTIVHARGIVG